jgi:tRNA(Ile)-lysidine synthase
MPRRVAVAVSGGRDSTALLHCTAHAARALGLEVWALHVHHGLMPQADAWLERLRRQARRWRVAFDSRRLQGAPAPGQSVEAWARTGRYQALGEMAAAAGCDLVLLAHHRRDQAETWLLQALRGAGAAGLSAMPTSAVRGGIRWARPWLGRPREDIEAYVRRHRLATIEDPSNADARYARSRLRQAVWPALTAAFGDAEVALAAAAARAQETAALATEVADLDLPTLVQGPALSATAWRALTPARRLNALRAWLRRALGQAAPESLLKRLDPELMTSAAGRWPAPGGELRLHRGLLALHRDPSTEVDSLAERSGWPLDLRTPGDHPLPAWGGWFRVKPVEQGGVAADRLVGLQPRARQGGERFRLAPLAARRSLKQQFQALGVPPWQRVGPLLYTDGGQLLYVPGLGLDGGSWARSGTPQLSVAWHPGPLPTTGERQGLG